MEYDCTLSSRIKLDVHYQLIHYKLPVRFYHNEKLVYHGLEFLTAIEHIQHWMRWYLNKPNGIFNITDLDVGDEAVVSISTEGNACKLSCQEYFSCEVIISNVEYPLDILRAMVKDMILGFQRQFFEVYSIDIRSLFEVKTLLSQRLPLEISATMRPFFVDES